MKSEFFDKKSQKSSETEVVHLEDLGAYEYFQAPMHQGNVIMREENSPLTL